MSLILSARLKWLCVVDNSYGTTLLDSVVELPTPVIGPHHPQTKGGAS